jgi:hypothetical protein
MHLIKEKKQSTWLYLLTTILCVLMALYSFMWYVTHRMTNRKKVSIV